MNDYPVNLSYIRTSQAVYFRYNEPMNATGRKPKKKSSAPVLMIADIDHIAKLANLPITTEQGEELTEQVGVTVQYVSQLQSLPTEKVIETSQVTGLENVFREDELDTTRMFTQKEALANAHRTHDGFFMVDAVLEEK